MIPATILKVVGIELTSIGRIEAAPGEEAIVLEDAAGTYRKLVISEGKIAGAILLGHGNDAAAVGPRSRAAFDVSTHLDTLRAGRWDVLAQLTAISRSSAAVVGREALLADGREPKDPPCALPGRSHAPARRPGAVIATPRRRTPR